MRHRAQDRRRDAQKGLRGEVRDLFQNFRMYSRFVLDLPRYLAQKDTVEGGRVSALIWIPLVYLMLALKVIQPCEPRTRAHFRGEAAVAREAVSP